MRLRILVFAMVLSAANGATALGAGGADGAIGQQQPPPDFVPVENAPPGEQIPAMPLLGAAYGFIWVGLLGYVWSLARRLNHVEAELTELESRKR